MRFRPAWSVNRRSLALASLFAATLVVAVAALWVLANATMPAGVPPPSRAMHFRLEVAGSDWEKSYESNASWNNSAFSFLLEGTRSLHLPLVWENWTLPSDSVLILSIGGDTNGDGGRWWQYWVNGAYGSVGADRAPLNDGDLLEWRFAQYPP